ncbi:MAG: carboxypeptidase regulatory-like domain-containing protein [Ktedonobacteraceae bacterium]
MQRTGFRWLSRRRYTIVAALAVSVLLISSIVLIPRGISLYAQSGHGGPNNNYVPSSAFGDTDDLPSGSIHAQRVGLAAGSATVSGVVKDASTGNPVANALVGISAGAVGSTAQYATTANDGSYSFSSIAAGTYNLAASRYAISGTQPFYKDAQQMSVNVSSTATVNFSLSPIAVPGSRTVSAGRAKNLIIVDYDETYHDSWFNDSQSMMNSSPATHQLAQAGVLATEAWTQYGWSPIDHYQIAVGSYPAWRTPDAPGKVWGQPDGLDTNIWYGGSEVFGQESIFDVAKSYGMNTAVIGGNDYPTGHITNANVDQISLGQNINGVPTQWVTEVENFITAHASNPNGFVVYMPITEAEGRSVESTSPDSAGGLYQQASGWDEQAFGLLQTWLQQNNYSGNTDVSITSDEAENDHTSFDNFYGVGSTGQGSTRHDPFVFAGPGIVSSLTYSTTMGIDDLSTNYMYALGLPAPVDSRGHVIASFFTGGGSTPTPTPTNTPSPTATNTPTPTPTNTPIPTNTPTPTATATNTPTATPTNTPTSTPGPGINLIQNGGLESSSSWVYGGATHPRRSSTQAHSGSYALKLGTSSGQQGNSTAYQMVTVPSATHRASLSFYYWPASNDSSTYGWQEADVINSSGTVLKQLFVNTTNDQSWIQMTFDLSSYAGQTIGIQFLDNENSDGQSYYTYMYVDDVTLNVS